MKDLYKPVFWCGFSLSMAALYLSSDRSGSVPTTERPRQPILMQISFGEEKVVPVIDPPKKTDDWPQHQNWEPVPMSDPIRIDEFELPELTSPSSQSVSPITTTSGTSGSTFFSAARELLGSSGNK